MIKKGVILVLLFISQWQIAQIQFDAKVSKTTLGLNEKLRVDFTMNADGDNFVPPNFEASGFKIYAGPNQSVSQMWVNGKSSFSKTYSYILAPLQKGKLVIKQASIEINNQIYKTTPIAITVTNAIELPKDPNNPNNPLISANDAVYLVAEVNKTNPFVNEPVSVVYKLYFSYNVGITNFKELNKPKYNDFWSQNIEVKELIPQEGTYQGQRFRYVVLKKTVLYPQKAGQLEIEPLTMDIDLELPTNRRNIFGQPFMTKDNKRVSAGAKTISVKPLPQANKPEDFTEAVGKFDFKVIPSRTALKFGESLELEVVVSGSGNLKLFDLPKPKLPSSVEVFEPIHNENVNTPLSGMTGRISDKYTLIPQAEGDFIIKPMRFSYFDYTSGSYKTILSKEIKIEVLDGPGLAQNSPVNSKIQKNTISKSKHFKYIKTKTILTSKEKKDFFGSALYYTLLLLPVIAIPLLLLFKKQKQKQEGDVVGKKQKLATGLARKYLFEAKKQLVNKDQFYIALEKALHNFLKAKLKIETSEMSKDKISELLQEKKVNLETVNEFIKLIESCEFARYAPATETSIQLDYEKATHIISALEKQIS